MANNLKGYDAFQVLRSVFDVDLNCLRVCIVDGSNPGGGGIQVAIDHTEDSIRLGDGTYFFTSTVGGGKVALDVNFINSSFPISATDLDIRNLQFANDKVDITGSSVTITEVGSFTNIYNEVLAVASGVLTNITSFTASQNTRLKQVDVSGENIATYEVLINGSVVSKKRTYFGGMLNDTFFFDKGINFISGQQVLIRVIHNRPTTANFNANLIVIEG